MRLGVMGALAMAALAAAAAPATVIFQANFNDFTNGTLPGTQYGTGLPVYALGDVPGWTKSNTFHAIHAVQRSAGDFAVMLYDTDIIYYATALAANTAGVRYQVSFDLATAVYSDPSQLTGAGDAINIRLNAAAGTVAQFDAVPVSSAFTRTSFTYTGTGSGNVFLLLQDNNPTDARFAGAIDNITVESVPEPAAWATMVAGFGAIGLALRRRRRLALA